MEILYSDASVAVVYKPAGVASQKSADGNDMLSLLFSSGLGQCFPVHRLDTVTEGLMVYARSEKAAAELSRQISGGFFGKRYYAVVTGEMIPASGDMEDLLFHDKSRNRSYTVKRERKGVKKALLSYKTVKTGQIKGQTYTLADITLHTGRTHQIRVQFASRKHPLAGDGKYGAKDNLPFMLCCSALSFINPGTGEKMSFSVPCPFSL